MGSVVSVHGERIQVRYTDLNGQPVHKLRVHPKLLSDSEGLKIETRDRYPSSRTAANLRAQGAVIILGNQIQRKSDCLNRKLSMALVTCWCVRRGSNTMYSQCSVRLRNCMHNEAHRALLEIPPLLSNCKHPLAFQLLSRPWVSNSQTRILSDHRGAIATFRSPE